MRLPFQEPEHYTPRQHLGVDYSSFTPFERQLLNAIDILEQRSEFASRRSGWAMALSMVALSGLGVIFAAAWPALVPVIRKIIE